MNTYGSGTYGMVGGTYGALATASVWGVLTATDTPTPSNLTATNSPTGSLEVTDA